MGTLSRDDAFMGQFRRPTGSQGRAVAALMNRGHDLLTDWGLSHVKIDPNFTVLDVGCGGGRTIGKLAGLAVEGRVFGIDYSKDMVEYSIEENKQLVVGGRVQVLEGSVKKMSFPNDFFDLVTAVETYYFWSNLPKAFKEIKRVLKLGGKLLMINEMIKDGNYERENAQTIAKTHVQLYTLPNLQQLLESAGLTDVKTFRKPNSLWNVLLTKKA
jgi:ubiquinone/menaquinone biosynthesis C-methylase UbiE